MYFSLLLDTVVFFDRVATALALILLHLFVCRIEIQTIPCRHAVDAYWPGQSALTDQCQKFGCSHSEIAAARSARNARGGYAIRSESFSVISRPKLDLPIEPIWAHVQITVSNLSGVARTANTRVSATRVFPVSSL